MLEVSANIPDSTIADFQEAFTRFHTKLGNGMGTAVKRGFSALCRSLIARTKVAPKLVPSTSVKKYDGEGAHYITPKGKGKKSMHRFTIKRRENSEDSWAYAKAAKSALTQEEDMARSKKRGLQSAERCAGM